MGPPRIAAPRSSAEFLCKGLCLCLCLVVNLACTPTPLASSSATETTSDSSSDSTDSTSETNSTTNSTGETDSSAETSDTGEPQGPPPAAGKNPFPWSLESWDSVCDDKSDNDGNDYTDCDDFSCSRNPSVIVCASLSLYESTPTLCTNGKDDDYDGRVDCADPDCFKNPFVNVCVQPKVEDRCGEGIDGDGDGYFDCDDNDCLALDNNCAQKAGSLRVLFDQTLDETASNGPNSDWIVDPWGRLPTPSNPNSRNEWRGSLSSFAFALYQDGHSVENLVAWEQEMTYGDASNAQDLSRYDVVIVIEPSRQLSNSEKAALINFVDDGGGLLLAANHVSADRDSNGWAAVRALNDLFDANPVRADPFGFRFDPIDIEEELTLERIEAPNHPVIDGPAGTVSRIGLYVGTSAHLSGGNPDAQGLIVLDDAASSQVDIVVGTASVGEGRVVFVTDSALFGDGSDSHGNSWTSKDAWNNPALDHAALFVNAVVWLGG